MGAAIRFLLFAVVATFVATLLGLFVLERGRFRVHASEQATADEIRSLGGAFRAVGADKWHISSVWLENTRASDADLEHVLKLPHIKYLDVSNTRVSDVSLPSIFSHPTLRLLKTKGSRISAGELEVKFNQAGNRVLIEDCNESAKERCRVTCPHE